MKKGLNFEGVIAYRPYGVIEIQALNGEPSYILAVSLIDSYRLKGHCVSLLILRIYLLQIFHLSHLKCYHL